MRCWPYQSTCGSSPRARGTGRDRAVTNARSRFIPACAGNGHAASESMNLTAVHPRVRGERVTGSFGLISKDGSSPRARGTGLHLRGGPAGGRFIPACAGNGRPRPPHRGRPAVHPRVRGERLILSPLARSSIGSSPRARGTVLEGFCNRLECRFIPACAGNGLLCMKGAGWPPVHPRVRGERGGKKTAAPYLHGSSPRARGTGPRHGALYLPPRFIPACAGNGLAPSTRQGQQTVHPRVRGERRVKADPAFLETGSSPRARGTVLDHLDCALGIRFIPACAGNGRFPLETRSDGPVHPRVRGERYLPAIVM